MAVSVTREILPYIQDSGAMPKTLPGVDQEDLHNEFTILWRKGLITSDREPIVTGLDAVVRDVIEPRLTDEGRDFLVDAPTCGSLPKRSEKNCRPHRRWRKGAS